MNFLIFREVRPDEEETEAMKKLELSVGFTVKQLTQQFKKKVSKSPQSLSELNGPLLMLLKQKCCHHAMDAMDLSPSHSKIYNELISTSVWEEESQSIRLQLLKFNSLTHKA